jgi:ATP-dependent RNA helicase DeaD
LLLHFFQSKAKQALVFLPGNAKFEPILKDLKQKKIKVEALHEIAYKSPKEQEESLESFATGKTDFLLTTEQVARGLDFGYLSQVYILFPPKDATTYLHLAGRVGRMGKPGTSTLIVDPENKLALELLQKQLNLKMEEFNLD